MEECSRCKKKIKEIFFYDEMRCLDKEGNESYLVYLLCEECYEKEWEEE